MCSRKYWSSREMGYDQTLTLVFEKRCRTKTGTAKFFAAAGTMACKALGMEKAFFDEFEEMSKNGTFYLRCSLSGRRIYDDGSLGDGQDSVESLSRKLHCTVRSFYQGEEPDDREDLVSTDGKTTSTITPVMVDQQAAELKRLDPILDSLRKKGAGKEAEEIRNLFSLILARLLIKG